jgi:dipeptidyl aminopeptidase/acylaminoacyl peptidase
MNYPQSMSPDGSQILVMESTLDRGYDLVIMSEDGDSVSFTDYLRADWNETMATISPDGARAAYVADEFGVPEVYIRSFPDAEDRVQVSDGGGTEPVWAPDGLAIYYRNAGSVMRASIGLADGFSVSSPQELFEDSWQRWRGSTLPPRTNWDVHPDGESFLFVATPGVEADEGTGAPLVRLELVVNWFEELRQRMGSN